MLVILCKLSRVMLCLTRYIKKILLHDAYHVKK
jgi:hypothetical protein